MSRLYFYLVHDDHPDDEIVNTFQAECTGDMSMNQFYYWQSKNVVDGSLDYYNAFRWKSSEVKEMLMATLAKKIKPEDENDRFLLILQDAVEMKSGLYAECEMVS